MSLPICLRASLSLSLAGILLPLPSRAIGSPASVTLDQLSQTYDGNPKVPQVTTDPPGLSVALSYTSLPAPAPRTVVETVYKNTPSPLALSYSSHPFSAQGTCGLGDRVQLAGTARDLSSVDVVLVTWAKAADYPVEALADPTGWHHSVKMAVYDMDDSGTLSLKGEITQSIFVPWRPLTYPGYEVYPYNGFAFQAHFDYPAGLVLPEKPVFVVSYNTGNSGFLPIGIPGPYDQLNVAGGEGPSIGVDDNPKAALWVRSATSWIYPATGTRPPMIVVKATRLADTSSVTPPVNAGIYQVVAKITDPTYEGGATADLSIQPADAQINLGNLTQVSDGSPKTITVTTDPAGIAFALTYDGGVELPTQLGRHSVRAVIQDPNYAGATEGELLLGQDLQSWMAPWLLDGSISPTQLGPNDDPDGDSIGNLLEYALGLDPSSPRGPTADSNGAPVARINGNVLSLEYRKNLLATDLDYEVQTSSEIGASEAWEPATIVEHVVSTEGSVQTIRSEIAPQPDEKHRFVRLSVTRR